jgi:hypothetical protein
MSKPAKDIEGWTEANRLLGDLFASIGSGVKASLGGGSDRQPSGYHDDWQERAAIMEYDGGLPREAAERFARELAALGRAPTPAALEAFDARLAAYVARRRP